MRCNWHVEGSNGSSHHSPRSHGSSPRIRCSSCRNRRSRRNGNRTTGSRSCSCRSRRRHRRLRRPTCSALPRQQAKPKGSASWQELAKSEDSRRLLTSQNRKSSPSGPKNSPRVLPSTTPLTENLARQSQNQPEERQNRTAQGYQGCVPMSVNQNRAKPMVSSGLMHKKLDSQMQKMMNHGMKNSQPQMVPWNAIRVSYHSI
jgi:hypothetical protein